jgi:hypothetical protein
MVLSDLEFKFKGMIQKIKIHTDESLHSWCFLSITLKVENSNKNWKQEINDISYYLFKKYKEYVCIMTYETSNSTEYDKATNLNFTKYEINCYNSMNAFRNHKLI